MYGECSRDQAEPRTHQDDACQYTPQSADPQPGLQRNSQSMCRWLALPVLHCQTGSQGAADTSQALLPDWVEGQNASPMWAQARAREEDMWQAQEVPPRARR